MTREFSFVLLNGYEIKIDITKKQIIQFPDNISDQMFEKGYYNVQSNVQSEVFNDFINHFINNSKILTINEHNILQIQLLYEEFEVTSDLLSNPELKQSLNASILSSINIKENQDKSQYENYISQNLDEFLEN